MWTSSQELICGALLWWWHPIWSQSALPSISIKFAPQNWQKDEAARSWSHSQRWINAEYEHWCFYTVSFGWLSLFVVRSVDGRLGCDILFRCFFRDGNVLLWRDDTINLGEEVAQYARLMVKLETRNQYWKTHTAYFPNGYAFWIDLIMFRKETRIFRISERFQSPKNFTRYFIRYFS